MDFYWKSIFAINLTNNNDVNFKVAQVIDNIEIVVFDIRETFKGRRSKTGVSLLVPEFLWLKEVLLSNVNHVYTLEHGNRVLKIEKRLDEICISVKRSDGKDMNISLMGKEIEKLVSNLNEFEVKIISIAKERKIPITFSEVNYVNKFVE